MLVLALGTAGAALGAKPGLQSDAGLQLVEGKLDIRMASGIGKGPGGQGCSSSMVDSTGALSSP